MRRLGWLWAMAIGASGCALALGLGDYRDQGSGGASSSASENSSSNAISVSATQTVATTSASSATGSSSSANSSGAGGAGGAAPLHIFVTSVAYGTADFGHSAQGATSKCIDAATAGQLANPNNYAALIAGGVESCKPGATYVLPDGTEVGTCSDLLNSSLKAPINVTEHKMQLANGMGPGVFAWTGLTINKQAFVEQVTCKGWSSNDAMAAANVGVTNDSGPYWLSYAVSAACTGVNHLYCIEQ